MTIVSKRKGRRNYHYFQDYTYTKVPVTTYIGTDESLNDIKKVASAFSKHISTVIGLPNIMRKRYHFENKPDDYDVPDVEIAKILYQFAIKNIDPDEAKEIEQHLFVTYVHSTTAIEGVTLTLGETKNLLSETEDTPDGKPFEDSQAVLNYKKVKNYLDNYYGDINEKFIKTTHKYIVHNLSENGKVLEGGSYRTNNNRGIVGVNHSDWKDIQRDLSNLLKWYNETKLSGVHPVELASIFHQRFEEIHPFYDGNGRTGRAILHFMLTSEKYPTIFFPPKQKNQYLEALRMGNTTNKKHADYVPLLVLLIQRMFYSLTYILAKTSLYDNFRASKEQLSSILPESIYSQIVNSLEEYRNSEEVY